jgi:restriction system protein
MAQPKPAAYIAAIVNALTKLGNSGQRSEVLDIVAEDLDLSEEDLSQVSKSGRSTFVNKVDFAKVVLAGAGYLSSSERGVWSLTERGAKGAFTQEDARRLLRDSRKRKKKIKQVPPTSIDDTSAREDEDEADLPPADTPALTGDHRSDLLQLMKEMAPDSFERLCQRFLREAGFQQVVVTGRSGDGGIDGKGLLQINALMSIHVLFQCKRYKGSVGSDAIRNFRGAMTGRTDKGIFITTGTFTAEAHREALREGAPPIELVDAEKLISMFEKLKLGLNEKTVYEIDTHFFNDFS